MSRNNLTPSPVRPSDLSISSLSPIPPIPSSLTTIPSVGVGTIQPLIPIPSPKLPPAPSTPYTLPGIFPTPIPTTLPTPAVPTPVIPILTVLPTPVMPTTVLPTPVIPTPTLTVLPMPALPMPISMVPIPVTPVAVTPPPLAKVETIETFLTDKGLLIIRKYFVKTDDRVECRFLKVCCLRGITFYLLADVESKLIRIDEPIPRFLEDRISNIPASIKEGELRYMSTELPGIMFERNEEITYVYWNTDHSKILEKTFTYDHENGDGEPFSIFPVVKASDFMKDIMAIKSIIETANSRIYVNNIRRIEKEMQELKAISENYSRKLVEYDELNHTYIMGTTNTIRTLNEYYDGWARDINNGKRREALMMISKNLHLKHTQRDEITKSYQLFGEQKAEVLRALSSLDEQLERMKEELKHVNTVVI
jgi:hypothetical protein